jgi:drug/metabolite transporter (DMT)-like permease
MTIAPDLSGIVSSSWLRDRIGTAYWCIAQVVILVVTAIAAAVMKGPHVSFPMVWLACLLLSYFGYGVCTFLWRNR